MTDALAEMERIIDAAQARMDAGEPVRRDLLSGLPYPPPPGEGYLGNLPWFTEEEADRVRELRHLLPAISREQAAARIAEKIMRRKAQKTYTSAATCTEIGGK